MTPYWATYFNINSTFNEFTAVKISEDKNWFLENTYLTYALALLKSQSYLVTKHKLFFINYETGAIEVTFDFPREQVATVWQVVF